MTHIVSLKVQGEKKSLEILYNVMQRSRSKSLYALACCDNPTERGGGISGVQDFIFSQCGTDIYLKFESYNLQ